MLRHLLWVCCFSVSSISIAAEKPLIFESIPSNAGVALGIRDIDALRKKGDQLLKDSEWTLPFRPTDLFQFVRTFLSLPSQVIPDDGLVLFVVNDLDENQTTMNDLGIIFHAPSREALAKAIDCKPEQIPKDGIPFELPEHLSQRIRWIAIRNGIGYGAAQKKYVEKILKTKPLIDQLPKSQQDQLRRNDLLFVANAEGMTGDTRKRFGKDLKSLMEQLLSIDERGNPGLRELVDSLESVNRIILGAEVNNGLAVRMATRFDADDRSKKLLQRLGKSDRPATLEGLPDGPVVLAQSAKGSGENSVDLARSGLEFLMQMPWLKPSILDPSDQSLYLGVFSEIWKRLRGSRFAVYLNPDPAKHGILSGVAILDTESSEQFVKEMKRYARFSQAEIKGLNDADDRAEIQKLVRQLGDNRFRVREAATTKLKLIGIPALVPLDEAMKDADADLTDRIRKIRDGIAQNLDLRKKEAQTPSEVPIRPTFGFVDQSTTIDGLAVETILIRFNREEKQLTSRFKQYFGPQWDQIHVATIDQQTVLSFGSNRDWMVQAAKHLRQKESPLTRDKQVQRLESMLQPQKKFQMQLSIGSFSSFMDGTWIQNRGKDLPIDRTGTSLHVEADGLQIDLFFPVSEIKTLNKSFP